MASKKQPAMRAVTVSLPENVIAQLERIGASKSLEEIVQDAVAAYVGLGRPTPVPAAAPDVSRLTPRLRQVLEMVAHGRTTREIAQDLGISVKTADWHRSELMKTLDLHGIADVVRYAIRAGVIEP